VRRVAAISFLAISASGASAAPMPYLGGTIRESFHNPGFNAQGNTTQAWDGNPAVAGWETSAASGQIIFGYSGSVSAGGMYGFRFDSSGETSPTAGSLGSRTTSETGPIHYGLGLRNESGVTITRLSLGFSAFVAHYQNQTADKLGFSWGKGETLATASFTDVPDAEYVPPAGTGKANPVASSVQRISVALESLDWQPGEVLWLRWTDHHDAVNGSMGMGIDHLYISTDADRVIPYSEWVFDETNVTETLHVNRDHPAANDTNAGTESEPLKTLQAAVLRAKEHSASGKGTRIQVHPGIYRELMDITSRAGNQPLIIEGVGEGEVVVSGSDVFSNWQASEIPNVYEHAWTYDFGWEPNPWPGDLALKYPQGTRRELLFLNKVPMTQVVYAEELAEGTYLVDDANDRVYFYPPVGVDPNNSVVEISVRPQQLYGENSKLLRVFRVNNVKLRNMVFEHAAAASLANDAAIAFRGCSNIVLEDVTLRYNNGIGASFSSQGDTPAENYLIRNFRLIGGGALGMDGGGVSNLLFDGGEVRLTNWRGALWGATGWAPCGFKFASYHGMHMRDYIVSQSHASGIWMDTDNRDVLFERVYSVNNYRSGFSLEANYGPITLRDCIIFGNSTGINGFDNSGVRVENTLIANNGERQVRFAGSIPLTEEELLQYDEGWSRDRQSRRHIPRNWTLVDNTIGVTANSISDRIYEIGLRVGSLLDEQGQPRFGVFAESYTGTGNTYSYPSGSSAPVFPNLTNFPVAYNTWSDLTGETGASWIDTVALMAALADAEELVGEQATGFSGLESATPIVTVEAVAPIAAEDGVIPAVFRFTREGGDLGQPLLINFALTGSAQMGVDYANVAYSVQIEPGETFAELQIVPIVDGLPEVQETVQLQVSGDIDGLYRLGNPSAATVLINDADALIPSALSELHPPTTDNVAISVELNNPTDRAITLEFGSLSTDYAVYDSATDAEVAHVWSDIGSSGTAVAFNWLSTDNDGVSGAIALPFAFPFYGDTWNSVYVHSNGFVTLAPLNNPSWRFTQLRQLPDNTTSTTGAMIAGFWSNLALDSVSRVQYRSMSDRFVVQYTNVYRSGVFGAKQRATFQIVLFSTGEINFVYQTIGYTSPSHSVGIQDATGENGLNISYNSGAIGSNQTIRLVPATAWMGTSVDAVSLAANGSGAFDLVLYPSSVSYGDYQHPLLLRDASTGEVLFTLPVTLAVADVDDVIRNAVAMGDWHISDWMGALYTAQLPYAYHVGGADALGWIRFHTTAESGLWFYSFRDAKWYWTSMGAFSWGWSANDQGWAMLLNRE